MSVPGVGPFVALTYKSSIEDPGRFARGEDVGAYAGLVPRRNQSGERDYKGRISKAGDAMLRSALYEAANNLLTRVKRPCALQTWGKKLAETKGPKRARVAVARKLAVLLHRLWQSETQFCWT
jgi:transposase